MSMLDLSGADLSGFDPIPADRYHVSVFAAEWRYTKGGPEAKLPEGTPMLNLQLRIEQEYAKDGKTKVQNSRVFMTAVLPPDGYDADKAAKMKGNFVRILKALGYDEKKINSGKLSFEDLPEDLVGRECIAVVAQKPKYGGQEGEMDNEVKGLKPLSEGIGSGTAASSLV